VRQHTCSVLQKKKIKSLITDQCCGSRFGIRCYVTNGSGM
jgi:hypothetical protein